ncbi:MAG: alpha/beta fold hydrolase [Victivallales bacterium]
MLDILFKYLRGKKCHLQISPKPKNDRNEIVILVHGLIRRSVAMSPMGRFLSRNGFTVYIYDYKTAIKGIASHGDDLREYLRLIIDENRDMSINLVTHSMGGILTRYALGEDNGTPPLDISRIKKIVMLAPPHGGSKVARRFVKYLPFTGRLLKPLPELSNAPDSVIHSAPLIEGPEIGIIAGKYDQEVAIKDTRLPGMKEHYIMRSEHSLMIYMRSIHKAILRFLTTGKFGG